jgi:hypothetical protein
MIPKLQLASSNQLHRVLGVTLKSAWFMSHRIREAMRALNLEPMGGDGKTVEIDETSQGFPEGFPKELKSQSGWQNRNVVFTLVERGGSVRSFHVEGTTIGQLIPIIRANISRETSPPSSAPSSRAASLNRSDCFLSLIFGVRFCFTPAGFPIGPLTQE